MSVAQALDRIRRGVAEIISEDELRKKLSAKRKLVIKAGFDPTAPDIHLGHTVLLRKLRDFQDLGHKVIFLIGDATGLVGDPSGQTQTRRLLGWEEVRQNATTYQAQVKKILLTDKENLEVRYNSEWFLGRSPQMRPNGLEQFDFMKLVDLAQRTTVARLIERDDFKKRLKANKPISLLELFYPLMQGYDSVKIAEQHGHCDVELGGTDQTFNLLMGRELLRAYAREPQVVLTMPLIEGTDGTQKMSKSLNNHIGIDEAPEEMFGKLMSISDALIVKYFILLTDVDSAWVDEITGKLQAKKVNPRDVKLELAQTVVSMYHGPDKAKEARAEFLKVFSRRESPSEVPIISLKADAKGSVDIVYLLTKEKLVKSKNEARRLLSQGAIQLNGKPLKEPYVPIGCAKGMLQVGSRRFRKLEVPSK